MRIGHLTDLHARWHQPGTSHGAGRRSRSMMDLLRQALTTMRQRGVEMVVLTGDLLDVPGYLLSHDDYYDYDRATWAADIEADYRLLRGILDASGLRYRVLPGNHDDLALCAAVFPPDPPIVDYGGYRFVSFWDRDFYANVPRRFDRERRLLERVLADTDSPPQIHLQHYVIWPELNEGWPHTYLEGAHLKRQLAASGRVRLALSGHYHLGVAPFTEGGCTFAVAPAFTQVPHAFRLYDVTEGGITSEVVPLTDGPLERGRKVVFLDRDGVLNEAPSYSSGPEPLTPVPSAADALRRLHEAGYVLIAVSSQSAIGYGYVTTEVVDSVFDRLARFLWTRGVCFDAFYYSSGAGDHAVHPGLAPHGDSKPSPHYLLAAAEQFQLDLTGSYMVGDNVSDLQAGRAAGVHPILVRTGSGTAVAQQLAGQAEWADLTVVADVGAAASLILGD